MSEKELKIKVTVEDEASGPAGQIKEGLTGIGDVAPAVQGTAAAVGEVKTQAQEAQEPVKKAGEEAEKAGEKGAKGFKKFKEALSMAALLMALRTGIKLVNEAIERMAERGVPAAVQFKTQMAEVTANMKNFQDAAASKLLPTLNEASFSLAKLTGAGSDLRVVWAALTGDIEGGRAIVAENTRQLGGVSEAASTMATTVMEQSSPAFADLALSSDIANMSLGQSVLLANADAAAREWEAGAIRAVNDAEGELTRTRASAVISGELTNQQVEESIDLWEEEGKVTLDSVNQQLTAMDMAIQKYKETGEAMPVDQAADMRGNLDLVREAVRKMPLDDATKEAIMGWLIQMKIDLDKVTEAANNATAAIGGISNVTPAAGGGGGMGPGGGTTGPGGGQIIESIGGGPGRGGGAPPGGGRGGASGGGTVINVYVAGGVYGGEAGLDELARLILGRVRQRGG